MKLLMKESFACVITRWLFRPLDSPSFYLRCFSAMQDKRIFQYLNRDVNGPILPGLTQRMGLGLPAPQKD